MHKCLGCLSIEQGNLAGVREAFDEALALYQSVEDVGGVCMMLVELGRLAVLEGRLDDAQAPLKEALKMAGDTKIPLHIGRSLKYLGQAARARGDAAQAATHFEEAEATLRRLGLRAEADEILHAQRNLRNSLRRLRSSAKP